jgi:hypothetical protein
LFNYFGVQVFQPWCGILWFAPIISNPKYRQNHDYLKPICFVKDPTHWTTKNDNNISWECHEWTCVQRSLRPSFVCKICKVVCSCWTLKEYASIKESAIAIVMAW